MYKIVFKNIDLYICVYLYEFISILDMQVFEKIRFFGVGVLESCELFSVVFGD